MIPAVAGLVGWVIGPAFAVFVWAVAFRARPETPEEKGWTDDRHDPLPAGH